MAMPLRMDDFAAPTPAPRPELTHFVQVEDEPGLRSITRRLAQRAGIADDHIHQFHHAEAYFTYLRNPTFDLKRGLYLFDNSMDLVCPTDPEAAPILLIGRETKGFANDLIDNTGLHGVPYSQMIVCSTTSAATLGLPPEVTHLLKPTSIMTLETTISSLFFGRS